MTDHSERWGSKIGLVLAMAGNAVGLLGLPLVFVEWTMGRWGGQRGHHSTPFAMEKMGKKKIWRYLGGFSFFTTIGIASYYCYLESWTITYLYHSIIGTFRGMSQSEITLFFNHYHDMSSTHSGIPYENVIAFLFCLALNVWILTR